VGGITDAATAGEKLDAGATLVQVYSGWIYRGRSSLLKWHARWRGIEPPRRKQPRERGCLQRQNAVSLPA
jgi:hypothetical protein